jgi:hypothetical protein
MEGPPAPLGLARYRERLPGRDAVPRPSRGQVLAVVLVALVVGGVWVRLADPVALRGDAPTVDPADPPAEVAADAVERLEYVDYTYRLATARGSSQVTQVDNTDREQFATFGDVRKRYVREGGAWVKLGSGGWREIEDGGIRRTDPAPFDHEAIRAADVTVMAEGDGRMVVAINDSATVQAVTGRPTDGERLQLFVDTDSGRLTKVRYLRVVGDTSGWWVFTFYNYRSTDVKRPPGVPERTLGDLLDDVRRD